MRWCPDVDEAMKLSKRATARNFNNLMKYDTYSMMAKREVSRRKEKGSSPRTVPDYDHSDDKKAEAFPASLRSALTLKLLRLMVWRSFRRPSLIISWSPLALCAIILVTSSLRVCSFPPVVTKTSGIRQQRPAMLQTLDAVACSVKQLNLRDKPPHWVKNRKHHYFTIKKVSELPLPDSLDKDCIPLGDWQEQHKIINCNTFHEIDITDISKAALIGKGGQNTVWSVQEYAGTRRALKIPGWILRQYISDDEYIPTPFYYEQDHLTQALIYDELSFSPHIANMYGFCSHSNLMEYSSETLLDLVDKKEFRDKDELFRIAYDVARAVADAHHFDSKGRATIVHRDIKVNQFILVNGMYRLNDFNLAHLMRWNQEKDEYCEFEGRGYKTNVSRASIDGMQKKRAHCSKKMSNTKYLFSPLDSIKHQRSTLTHLAITLSRVKKLISTHSVTFFAFS